MQQCYDNSVSDIPAGICETESGYAVLTEVYNATGTPGFHALRDFHIRFVDTLGNTLFEKCYGGSKSEYPKKILKTGDGNFLLFGKTNSVDGDLPGNIWGYNDLCIIKINQNGDIIFSKTYGSTGDDSPGSIILLPDGGFMFCGTIYGDGGDVANYYGDGDMWICKCDQNGNIVSQMTFGDDKEDKCNDILLNDGNIIVGGAKFIKQSLVTMYGARLFETDFQGNILWDSFIPDSVSNHLDSSIEALSILKTTDGYMTLCSSVGGTDYNMLLKTDNQGQLEWKKKYGTYGGYAAPAYITQLDDGNYLLLGCDSKAPCNHALPSQSTTDIWLAELATDGDIILQQCYGGYGDENLNLNCVIKKSDYHYVIAGDSDSDNSGDVTCENDDRNVWLVEMQRCPGYEPGVPDIPSGPDTVYSANHPQITFTIEPPQNAWTFNWKMEPDTAGELTGYGLYAEVDWAPDFSGTVQLFAQSVNYCGESQWSEPKTVSVFNTIGTDEYNTNEVSLKVYPNPSNGDFIIESALLNGKFNVKIYDITGNMVVNEFLQSNRLKTNLQDGIYFVKIIDGENVYLRKIVIENK